ncbi:hypothetical protein KEM48_012998 [Puccinia striiformis f. sp. tritici PST-130]|nr:hypothetical protein KEM48_012998 [Puccinia striiformis f. sp. tritici PST-130]
MLLFVFQDEETAESPAKSTIHSSVEALVDWVDKEKVQHEQPCFQRHLGALKGRIDTTRLLTPSVLKQQDQLIDSLNQSIEALEQAKTKSIHQQDLLASLQASVSSALSVQTAWNIGEDTWIFTQRISLIDHSGGKARSYLQDVVAHALDTLLESKGTKGGTLASIRDDEKKKSS